MFFYSKKIKILKKKLIYLNLKFHTYICSTYNIYIFLIIKKYLSSCLLVNWVYIRMTKENSRIDLSYLEEVADWTSSEVAEWFQKIGFGEYSVSS